MIYIHILPHIDNLPVHLFSILRKKKKKKEILEMVAIKCQQQLRDGETALLKYFVYCQAV